MNRPQRADARRNRQTVLDVAIATFAAEGLSVPVHEIARRAGVGTGTVSRHFPTKESLFEAIVAERIGAMIDRADELAATRAPGEAFGEYVRWTVGEASTDLGLAQALTGAGFDIEAAAARTGKDLTRALGGLLEAAQRSGDIRPDVTAADVKALVNGCLSHPGDAGARLRLAGVVLDGLRAG